MIPERKAYYVYIMTNVARTLYVGVTNNLERRVFEHKNRLIPGFTDRYGLTSLAYFESTDDVSVAIAREKQVKGWLRNRKVTLIESMNADWADLSEGWFDDAAVNDEMRRKRDAMDSSLRSE
jgi:putative endonuclease